MVRDLHNGSTEAWARHEEDTHRTMGRLLYAFVSRSQTLLGHTPVWKNAREIVHPSLGGHLEDLMSLCERCWNRLPENRPNIDEIVQTLIQMSMESGASVADPSTSQCSLAMPTEAVASQDDQTSSLHRSGSQRSLLIGH